MLSSCSQSYLRCYLEGNSDWILLLPIAGFTIVPLPHFLLLDLRSILSWKGLANQLNCFQITVQKNIPKSAADEPRIVHRSSGSNVM